ncbi:MAG: (Fe-S)-binding protein [Gammaproteobacteria bacterium]|nr:(Fe-S)-binding protein [Gammaproteobacteria bacterium]
MKVPALEYFRHTMEQCNHCGQCKWIAAPKSRGVAFAEICPIHMRFGFDAYSGQGLLNIAQEVLEGTLDLTPELAAAVYSCTTCGACDTNCKSIRDMEVLETILALRRRIAATSPHLPPALRAITEHIAATHNMYGLPHEQRFAWLTDSAPLVADADTVYYVGDRTAYRSPDVACNTLRILAATGVPFTVLNADEWNDGNLLWRTGQVDAAACVARHNIDALHARNTQTVICSDAESLSVMRDFYPRVADLRFNVRHITEIVADALRAGRLRFTRQVRRKATYHDPCYLGRLSEPYVHWEGEIQAFNRHVPPKAWRRGGDGVYDAPRAVLQAIPGLQVTEMVRHAEASMCCGGGGGVAEWSPGFAQWVARERLTEAAATGADLIVSAAPLCAGTLQSASTATPAAVCDITQLIVDAL